MWMGGQVPLGYELKDRKLIAQEKEAKVVRRIFERYVELGCVRKLAVDLKASGIVSKRRVSAAGKKSGGALYSRGALYSILANRLYRGEVAHRGSVYAGEHPALIDRALWERVQEQLSRNRTAKRTGERSTDPSLLASLLYDDQGNRLTPSHCVNAGKRYRYYFSQGLLESSPGQTSAVRRVPAAELERLVIKRYCDFLASSAAVADLAEASDDARARQRLLSSAKELAKTLPKYAAAHARGFLLAVTSKVALAQRGIEIVIAKPSLRSLLLGIKRPDASAVMRAPQEDDLMRLRIEAKLLRCGSEIRLVIPPAAQTAESETDMPLLKAIARAHDWYEELISGKATSLGAIAKGEGVHKRYIGRLLRCAFLAPDIIEAALEGRQPPILTVEKLRSGLPPSWEQQRRLLGFA
jgi:hypothetical protein